MNAVANPFSPGAGTQPPELAGRQDIRETVRVALERSLLGRSARSVLIVGLRGVGKTVLLEKMRSDAENSGFLTLRMEAPEGRSLPALLAPQLRQALLKLSRFEGIKDLAHRGLRALAGFAKVLKVQYEDLQVGLDFEPEQGLADNGDLEQDLETLLLVSGQAAAKAKKGLVLFIDELQYVEEDQLAALILALHRSAMEKLPITLVGAGLPQLRGKMGRAKSYAERLFEFPEIGPLPDEAARQAIIKPIVEQGAAITPQAVQEILKVTQGYPYFLQEWGKHSWEVTVEPPIKVEDVLEATRTAIAALDESFFRVRFDRLTPSERRYLRAMAHLGQGPHRSGDIAKALEKPVSALAPIRNQLITKGMIWSPFHGDTAFTVPMFDGFMQRAMPGEDWRET